MPGDTELAALARRQVPALALFMQQRASSETAAMLQSSMEYYRAEYFRALAELQLLQAAVGKAVGGRVMPTPRVVLEALHPDRDAVKALGEVFAERGFA